ncbi:AraC family transcriptional regulator [Burkholderia cepacia]|uniref:AraC family transcriptional regulator n=1 Tax=Burkholderia cepacia TaxID=292 RepID=UPI0007549611|nr:AraC family transcriptional regulator [Burkholderia cepacia]KVK98261.1 AraC family transcriptional regulator [Burkholderia cepacia]
MFASEGLDVPRLLADVGIDKALLNRPDTRFGADQITRLWDLAVASSGNPALGLNRQLAARHVDFDVVGYAMLACADLCTSLQTLARYLAVVSDAATFELLSEGPHSWLVLGHVGNTLRIPRQRQEYGLLSILAWCEWLTRRDVRPLCAEFAAGEPMDIAPYQRAFGCPLRFGQPRTRLLLAKQDLATALPSHNPALLTVHGRLMQERCADLGNLSIRCRVTHEIQRRLHLGEPRREEVAADLALTDRTLQRRLQAERTSFQQLLDNARRELARKHLADQQHGLAEIADLLGFVDQSNLFRACRRWFGMPPGQYRQQLICMMETGTLNDGVAHNGCLEHI